jgi:hypothetical protein
VEGRVEVIRTDELTYDHRGQTFTHDGNTYTLLASTRNTVEVLLAVTDNNGANKPLRLPVDTQIEVHQ